MKLAVLDPSRARDFEAVMRTNAEAARCLCTAAYVEPALARPCRDRTTGDGFLLYRDGAPIGWCQAAPRDTLGNLVRGRGLPPDPAVWAVSCMVLVPEAQGFGLSHRFLALVLEELRRRGVARVEVFACRYGRDEDTSAFIELPESLCRGMALEHDHPMRPIYGLALTRPTPPGGS